jgi:predicted nucleic acid-binding protein
MTFWDSSALVGLLIKEHCSEELTQLWRHDDTFVVWWGTETECLSALARREREGGLSREQVGSAEGMLRQILDRAYEVMPSTEIRHHSRRLLMTHPLRAGDALQLAAAVLFADSEVQQLPFLTMDKNLAACAEREGFSLPAKLRKFLH